MYMTHARGAMRRNSHAIEKKSTGVKSQNNCQSCAPVTLLCPPPRPTRCCLALSSPPPLLHLPASSPAPPLLLACTSSLAPPFLHLHQTSTGIQDRRCSLWATLADWFPFLGPLGLCKIFPPRIPASTGFLSLWDLASTGFLIGFSVFCTDYGEYWFSSFLRIS